MTSSEMAEGEGESLLLTTRQREVGRMLITGASNKQIARQLVIQTTTVKHHVRKIMAKTYSQNRTQAALALLEQLGGA